MNARLLNSSGRHATVCMQRNNNKGASRAHQLGRWGGGVLVYLVACGVMQGCHLPLKCLQADYSLAFSCAGIVSQGGNAAQAPSLLLASKQCKALVATEVGSSKGPK